MTGSPTEQLHQNQQERWTTFCREAGAADPAFSQASEGAGALATAFGFSEFVAANCIRHPRMALALIDSDDLFTT